VRLECIKRPLDKAVVQHVVLGNTKIKPANQVVHPVVLGNTMVNKANQVVHHAVLGNTMVNKDKLPKLVANHVQVDNTVV